MRPWLARLLGLMTITQAVYAGARVLVSYRVLELGGDAAAIGLLTALFAITPLVLTMATGRAIDRRRGVLVVNLGIALTAVSVVVLALAPDLIWLAAGYIVLGFAQMLTTVAAQGLALALSTPQEYDTTFSGVTLAVSLGQSIGFPIAGVVAAAATDGSPGAVVALLTMAALSLTALPLGLAIRQPPPREPRPGSGRHRGFAALRSLLGVRGMRPAMLSSLMVLVGVDIVAAYLPVLGEALGLSVLTVAILLTVRSISSLLSRLFVPRLVRTIPRAVLLVGGTLGAAVPVAMLPITSNPVVLATLLAIAGFFWGVGQPLTMTWVATIAPAGRGTEAVALRIVGNRLGQVVLPLAAGVIAGVAGVGSAFFATSALLAIAGASTWRSLARGDGSSGDPDPPSPN